MFALSVAENFPNQPVGFERKEVKGLELIAQNSVSNAFGTCDPFRPLASLQTPKKQQHEIMMSPAMGHNSSFKQISHNRLSSEPSSEKKLRLSSHILLSPLTKNNNDSFLVETNAGVQATSERKTSKLRATENSGHKSPSPFRRGDFGFSTPLHQIHQMQVNTENVVRKRGHHPLFEEEYEEAGRLLDPAPFNNVIIGSQDLGGFMLHGNRNFLSNEDFILAE